MASPHPSKTPLHINRVSPLGRHRTIVDGASLRSIPAIRCFSFTFNGHEAEFNTAIDNYLTVPIQVPQKHLS